MPNARHTDGDHDIGANRSDRSLVHRLGKLNRDFGLKERQQIAGVRTRRKRVSQSVVRVQTCGGLTRNKSWFAKRTPRKYRSLSASISIIRCVFAHPKVTFPRDPQDRPKPFQGVSMPVTEKRRPSWRHLSPSWRRLGPYWRHLGPFCCHLYA